MAAALSSSLRKAMKPKLGYVQTKITFCKNPPFSGLGALGMWYGHALESEIKKWETDSRTSRLAKSPRGSLSALDMTVISYAYSD
jgi:hypothetical protein